MRASLILCLSFVGCAESENGSPYGDPRSNGDPVVVGDARGDEASGDPAGDSASGDPAGDAPGDAVSGDAVSGDAPGDAVSGDAAGGDAGPGMWDHCPTAADYVGHTWGFAVEVDPLARFCNQSHEGVTLPDERLRKTMARIAPGSYAIPDAATTGPVPFTLPVCFAFAHGEPPTLDGTGTVEAYFNASGEDEYFTIMARQALTAGGEAWDLRLNLSGLRTSGQTVMIADGTMASDEFGFGPVTMELCRGTDCYSSATEFRSIAACDFSALPSQNHHVEFTDGSRTGVLDLYIHMGFSPASTEPAMFVLGGGTFDGVAFSQGDYWQLFYRPTHHHFTRDFGLLFDAPIGGACGIAIYELGGTAVLYTVDCELGNLATTWTITDQQWNP